MHSWIGKLILGSYPASGSATPNNANNPVNSKQPCHSSGRASFVFWKKGAGRRLPEKIDSARASGPLARGISGLLPSFCLFPGSQWSTLQSGQLAQAFSGLLPDFCLFPGSQWSTLQSGPLAHAFSGQMPDFCLFPGS